MSPKNIIDRNERFVKFISDLGVETEYSDYGVKSSCYRTISDKTYRISYVEILGLQPYVMVEEISGNMGNGFLGSNHGSIYELGLDKGVYNFPIYVLNEVEKKLIALSFYRGVLDVPSVINSSVSSIEITSEIDKVLEFFDKLLFTIIEPHKVLLKEDLLEEAEIASSLVLDIWSASKTV